MSINEFGHAVSETMIGTNILKVAELKKKNALKSNMRLSNVFNEFRTKDA